MKYILNDSLDPYFNLALEEYIFKNQGMKEDFFILWQNNRTIVVGRHQNTIEEINRDFIQSNNINVVRRITGGGAVYHDLGNINFSFITSYDKNKAKIDFKTYTDPVIKALEKLGVKAELTGRNDLTIENKKFSGNAQSLQKGRILHHGTLLFDSDLDMIQNVLNVSLDKIKSKGIKSVRSRVTNIKEHLKGDINIDTFKKLLVKNLFKNENVEEYIVTDADLKNINELKENKYVTWEWNYGKSPKFNFRNSKRFSNGKLEVLLDVKNGVISECKLYGDFLALYAVDAIEDKIKGLRYDRLELDRMLNSVSLEKYFGNITKDEVLECFF